MKFLIFILIFICLVAIVVISLVSGHNRNLLRVFGIYFSQLVYSLSLIFLVIFDKTIGVFQFVYESSVIPLLNIGLVVGIDGISLFLIILTTLLTSVCILVSWEAVENNLKYFI